MNLSFVIVSFKSFHLVEKNIQAIEKKNQIIVVENSLDRVLKEKLEKLYNNVEVIIPEKNLGFGKALNLGIKRSKNNFVICMVPDAVINKECILNISNILSQFKEFSLLSPTYFDNSIYKSYDIFKKEITSVVKKQISNFILREVDDMDGRILIINKDKFDSTDIMDEKIFMYFEYADLCLRLKKKNQKLYVIENLKFNLSDKLSNHPNFQKQVQITRNWHHCWSKFYFYYKHYNYFFAFRKTLPNLIRSIRLCIYFKFKNDHYNLQLHKSELSGLINAYLLKSSFYRPNIN